jgi:hypothetical protein
VEAHPQLDARGLALAHEKLVAALGDDRQARAQTRRSARTQALALVSDDDLEVTVVEIGRDAQGPRPSAAMLDVVRLSGRSGSLAWDRSRARGLDGARAPAKRVANSLASRPIRSKVQFGAGPSANNPGPRAVLRRYAPSATRQRTLEANGIDCGAGRVSDRSGPSWERYGSRPVGRAGRPCNERRSSQRTANELSAQDHVARQAGRRAVVLDDPINANDGGRHGSLRPTYGPKGLSLIGRLRPGVE